MYLRVLDQVADSRDTVIDVLYNLHDNFKIGESTKYLTVEVDAKIFVHLEALKLEYGKVLEWLIPFPGDFHILKNGFAYICLYSALRSGTWELRQGAIKSMAPLFNAFDRQTYRKIIPQLLADCIILPQSVLDSYACGGFVVSIKGKEWHSVGIDEAHEMMINKDCKLAIVRPSSESLSKMALYFPFVIHNFKNEIQLDKEG